MRYKMDFENIKFNLKSGYKTGYISTIGANAYGVIKSENEPVVFVPYTLPEEKVAYEIIESHQDYCMARLLDVIEPSSKRVKPECPIFQTCGGCNFLHTDYDEELKIKQNVLLETLKKIGKIEPDFAFEVIPSPMRFNYRNNAHIKTTNEGGIGFFENKSLNVVPFPSFECKLLTLRINSFLKQLDRHFFLFTRGFTIRDGKEIYTAHLNYSSDSKFCEYTVNNFTYRVGISDFFQVNSHLLNIFQSKVVSLIDPDLKTVELYGGSGFFSLPLATKMKELTVNEISSRASENGKYNAKLNKVDNIKFIASDASIFMKKVDNVSQILVDPPRAGLEKNVIESIENLKIKKLIYVSCNPSTFARDFSYLRSSGFELTRLILIDNFPGTFHTELISLITRD